MATAPIPGSRAHAEAASKFIRIRVKDRTLDVMPDLTMKERFVVRNATGTAFEAFLPAETENGVGEDTLFILWWVGRRQNGEPNLPFNQAQTDWPTDIGVDDLELDLIDLDGEPEADDSPESSGPDSAEPGPNSPTTSG